MNGPSICQALEKLTIITFRCHLSYGNFNYFPVYFFDDAPWLKDKLGIEKTDVYNPEMNLIIPTYKGGSAYPIQGAITCEYYDKAFTLSIPSEVDPKTIRLTDLVRTSNFAHMEGFYNKSISKTDARRPLFYEYLKTKYQSKDIIFTET